MTWPRSLTHARGWILGASAAALATLGAWALWAWTHPLPRLVEIRKWAMAGNWPRAEAEVNVYLARRPKDADALMLAAQVAGAQHQLDRCAQLLDRVPDNSPLKSEALLRHGQVLWQLDDARGAEQSWQSAIRRAVGQELRRFLILPRSELVALFALERRAAEARTLIWEMYPDHQERWRLLLALARLDARSTSPQVGVPKLERIIERDPADVNARVALASYLIDLSRWDEAAEHAERCLELNPSEPRALEIVLQCHLRNQQWDAMDQALRRPDLDPNSALIWRLRGQRLEAGGQRKEAEASFREALRLNPNDLVAHFQLAQLLLRADQRESAQPHLTQFRELQSHQDAVNLVVGTYVGVDDRDWEPPSPATCTELAEHCQALGRADEARGWLSEASRRQKQGGTRPLK